MPTRQAAQAAAAPAPETAEERPAAQGKQTEAAAAPVTAYDMNERQVFIRCYPLHKRETKKE